MSARPVFATVAEYLAALKPEQAKALKQVLALVRKTVPAATPVISYGIPAFSLGRVFIYCAAFKQHVGIYPPVRGDAGLQKALQPYANAKGNLSFVFDEPLPRSLLARVIKALARQYRADEESRPKKKSRSKRVKSA